MMKDPKNLHQQKRYDFEMQMVKYKEFLATCSLSSVLTSGTVNILNVV